MRVGLLGSSALAPPWDADPVVSLGSDHRLPSEMPPASSWACRADPILRGLLTAEGTHPTGEASESREPGSFPTPIRRKGPLVVF